MVDRNKVAEICAKHRLQPRIDVSGNYWVHPDFRDTAIIHIDKVGNWEDGTPEQQVKFQTSLGTKFDNSSLDDLDRYLTTMIKMLRLKENPPKQD